MNILKNFLLIFIVIVLSISLTACKKNVHINNAEKITYLLNQKYGIEFEVKSIGNRLASDKADTVIAHCYPKNNKKVIFEAKLKDSDELVFDDYPVRLLETTTKESIEATFTENGIDATVTVSIARLSNSMNLLNADLKDVISRNPELSLAFTTILCNNSNPRKTYDVIIAILDEFYSGNPKMLIGTTIWKYSNDTYKKCSDEMNSLPYISKTVLEQYNPISKVNVALVDGEINTNYEQFRNQF